MLKKIIISFFIVFVLLLTGNSAFSYSVPVENIFTDIDEDYKYLHELQTFYDKGMIKPDTDWNFNPRALLNRDEFVWILQEVTCKKCIQPNTDYDFINKYEDKKIFFDINKINPYFYCIANASDEWYIKWYHEWDKCDDWSFHETEKPFCPNNTIVLEEAIAIILRTSWILTNEEAQKVRMDIFNWKVTKILSSDVSPKNVDGSVYSFYPDIQKALEYVVMEADKNWNVKTHYLIDIVDWKIRPKQSISKEMFLHIAYVALKANACEDTNENELSLQIKIRDKTCKESQSICKQSNLSDNSNTYDFTQEIYTSCSKWISDSEWFIWRFYNPDTSEEYKKYWKYIENYELPQNWTREIFLRVVDKCWNTWEVKNRIDTNWTSVSMKATPIFWKASLLVNYLWKASWGVPPYTYYWDFWDWRDWLWVKTENLFKESWIYETVLYVTDANWKMWSASVLINALSENDILYNQDWKVVYNNVDSNDDINNNENTNEPEYNETTYNQKDSQVSSLETDSDKDGVNDMYDVCPLIKWSEDNKWCPIEENKCDKTSDCDNWYECHYNWVCTPKKVTENCEYTWGDIIMWNIMCNSCPCNIFLDFTSTLRKCDIVFPAITSEDNSVIYSRGELYQIK